MPDALPVISKGTVDYTVMTVLAPTCIITEFDCKNYFYLDTPKGHQISQHYAFYWEPGAPPFSFMGERLCKDYVAPN